MDTFSIVLSLVILVLVLAPAAYGIYLVLSRDDGRLRLFEVLNRQGVPLPESASEAAVLAGAHAVRRCVGCPSQARCDQLVAQGDWRALGAICPNEDYVSHLRAEARVS